MTSPLSYDRLRELLEAATPGPLSTGGVFMPNSARQTTSIWGPTSAGMQSGEWVAKEVLLDDAALFVAAVNALPDLLTRIADLKGENARLRELEKPRPFSEWNEDHRDVLWWRLPIQESPYVGSPLDLGRSMKVVVQVGFEEHDLPITMTGGWPFSEDDEEHLVWTPLPDASVITSAALRALSGTDTGEKVG